jgi:2-keto-3-deoxy-L-rhamnonate aldolase RhmA
VSDAPRIGTFIKTPHHAVVEVLALSGLGFAVLDAEHAPLDRGALDTLLLAGTATGLPLFVRVPDAGAATLLSVLDLGAAGVVVPHVDDAAQAAQVVARCRYRGGVRGYSSSPRAAGYGTLSMARIIERGDAALVMCQIESPTAVANARAIAAVPGVQVLFIGRADLALAMGLDGTAHPEVDAAVDTVMTAARAEGKAVAVAVGNARERDAFAARGADWIVVGSDQSFLRQAAVAAAGIATGG